ncbi:hypothetical protein BDDG_11852 [Blastomyces dermatitidis ATCC 18188]|uniref:Uncharacterized protein n=1 Tax=Ajellomyces dermatitidis (strain ATCC 18188 / CBS 674.68) TaxID=653446 RepID=A0A0J9ELM0_AJEDA|nr:hypothetical protein BDFG_08763 [Blastomyces dermatitidis ATCC 26199]KMW67006.1 hypothetical protein BDDG_11852 [Blastomyces dermatitidis ATCC 18188]
MVDRREWRCMNVRERKEKAAFYPFVKEAIVTMTPFPPCSKIERCDGNAVTAPRQEAWKSTSQSRAQGVDCCNQGGLVHRAAPTICSRLVIPANECSSQTKG